MKFLEVHILIWKKMKKCQSKYKIRNTFAFAFLAFTMFFYQSSVYEDLNLKFLFSLKAVLKFFLTFLFELWITQKRVTYPRLTSTVLLKRFWVEEQAIKIQSYYDRVRGRVKITWTKEGRGPGVVQKTTILNDIYLVKVST